MTREEDELHGRHVGRARCDAARQRSRMRSSARERIHTGKIIKLDRDHIRYPDGSEAEVDIVRHSGASAVVPFLTDPEGDDPQILCSGSIATLPVDTSTRSRQAGSIRARRRSPVRRVSSRKRPAVRAKSIEPLITMLTTPGFTDERIHLFMATELTHGEARARSGRVRRRGGAAAVRGARARSSGARFRTARRRSASSTRRGSRRAELAAAGSGAARCPTPIGTRQPHAPIECQKWTLDRGILA